MIEVRGHVHIDRTPLVTWQALADLSAVERYLPGVRRSYYTSDQRKGVGASRHCDVKNGLLKGYLKERVIRWEEGRAYTIELYASKGVPYRRMEAEFHVEPDGTATRVTQIVRFEMRGGPMAPILGFVGKRMMKRYLPGMLQGFKAFAERNDGPGRSTGPT